MTGPTYLDSAHSAQLCGFLSAQTPFMQRDGEEFGLRLQQRSWTGQQQARMASIGRLGTHPRWIDLTGCLEAAGSFLHIRPDTGPMAILLPASAQLCGADGSPIDGRQAAGSGRPVRLAFRRSWPSGGLKGVGPGIEADFPLGWLCGLLHRHGGLREGRLVLRMRAWQTDRQCPPGTSVRPGLGGWEVGADPRVVPLLRAQLGGLHRQLFPASRQMQLADAFQRGFVLAQQGRTKVDSALLRWCFRSGLSFRLGARGLETRDVPRADCRCRVELVLLPGRMVLPCCPDWALHPSGLPFRLPADPSGQLPG